MYIPRNSWTSFAPKTNKGADQILGVPNFREPVGVVLHSLNDNLQYTYSNPTALLERQLRLDFSTKGLGDIAYNFAVPATVAGFYCLRGIISKSNAQQDVDLNSQYISVLALLGNTEEPTDQLLLNLDECVHYIQTKYDSAEKVLPFSELYRTVSPGEPLEDYINGNNNFNNGDRVRHTYLPPAPIPVGNNSVHVFDLIEALAFYGYYESRNDGVYGPLTTKAVRDLQQDLADKDYYPKQIDGVYGRWTRDAWEFSLN